MMTPERAAEIRAMLDAITPGNWEWEDWDDTTPGIAMPNAARHVTAYPELISETLWVLTARNCKPYGDDERFPAIAVPADNATFIAAAPAIVRELLADSDFWRTRCDRLLSAVLRS